MKIRLNMLEVKEALYAIDMVENGKAEEAYNNCLDCRYAKITYSNKDTVKVINPRYKDILEAISSAENTGEVEIEIKSQLLCKAIRTAMPHMAGFYNIGKTVAHMYKAFSNSMDAVIQEAIREIPYTWKHGE